MGKLYPKITANAAGVLLSLAVLPFPTFGQITPGTSLHSFFWTQDADESVLNGCYGYTKIGEYSNEEKGYLSTFWLSGYTWWQQLFSNTYINIALNTELSQPAQITRASGHFQNTEWITGLRRQGSNDYIRFHFPVLPLENSYGRYDYFTVDVNDTLDLEFYGAGDSIMVGTFVHKKPDERGAVNILGRNAIIVELTDANPLRIKSFRCNGTYKTLLNAYFQYDLNTFQKDKAWYGISIIDTLQNEPTIVVHSIAVGGAPQLQANSTTTISWQCNLPSEVDSFQVNVSYDNKRTWKRLGKTTSETTFTWKIDDIQTDSSFIRITAYTKNRTTASDQSEIFGITPNIAVHSIDIGGETQLKADSVYYISWQVDSPSDVDSCLIYASFDNRATWNTIGSTIDENGIDWTIPNLKADSIYIKVTAFGNNGKTYSDVSDELTILPEIAIISLKISSELPLNADADCKISWDLNFPSEVKYCLIEVSYDNKKTWDTVSEVDSGSSYTWTVPNLKSDSAYIKLKAYCTDGITISELTPVFEIVPEIVFSAIDVTDAEYIKADSVYKIHWDLNYPSEVDSCILRASFDNNKNWTDIGRTDSGSVFDWMIPNVLSDSTSIKIFAYQKNGHVTSIVSSMYGIIPHIIVDTLFVEGASPLKTDSTYEIRWELNFPSEVDSCRIAVSFDNQSTWEPVGQTDSGQVYNWTIPVLESDSAYFKITVFGTNGQVTSIVSDHVYGIDRGPGTANRLRRGREYAPSFNPVANGQELRIMYTLPKGASRISVSLFDLKGRQIEQTRQITGISAQIGSFPLMNSIKSGYYYIRFNAVFNNGKLPIVMTKKWLNIR
ncbi:MAG: hypothetical protein JW863_15725 [Chitinispirillaceae bacterium]|nr:hypothetical protein [Chitinispirillaceae bacterium]